MSARAHVRDDWPRGLVAIAVLHERGQLREVLQWPSPIEVRTYDPANDGGVEGPDTDWLYIPEADAHAIYEALAEHFGHAGHDIRSLRKDYDAERARVDKFIGHLTGGPR